MAASQVASLTNHACSPNCRVAWGPRAAGGEARTLRLIAATAMEVGDEIFLSYGPVAGRMPLCDRRAALERQYCFHCRCAACEAECEEAKAAKEQEIEDEAAFASAVALLDAGEHAAAIPALEAVIKLRRRVLSAHDRDGATTLAATAAQRAADAFDALARAQCMSGDYASASEACEAALTLLRRSVAPGAEPSLAREEVKLCHLRFNAAVEAGPGAGGDAAVAKAAAAVEQALSAVSSALGPDDPSLADLRQMQIALDPAKARAQAESERAPVPAPAPNQPTPSISQAGEISECVALLRQTEMSADERLQVCNRLHALLAPGAGCGEERDLAALVDGFIAASGPEALHIRLSSMEGDWMAEVRNGAMEMYEKLARLDRVWRVFARIQALDAQEVHAAAPCYDCEPATKAATGSSTNTKAVKLRRQKGSAREVLLDSNLPFN